MFEHVQPAPPDPILGLTEAWKRDPNPRKVNLGAGVYQDDSGHTPVLPSVKAAETVVLGRETTKTYLPILGEPAFAREVTQLVFKSVPDRVRVAYAPGGTGALRVGADLVTAVLGRGRRVWVSQPTWPNHPGLFTAAGYEVQPYPYYDPSTQSLRRTELFRALETAQEGDVVVLHVTCHNPTGVDLDPDDWARLIELASRRRWLPFLDAAYLGFDRGLDEDAEPLRRWLDSGLEFMAAVSFSKNMGLYRERVGALVAAAMDPERASALATHMQRVIRVLFSNAVGHGQQVAVEVLSDPLLRDMWRREVTAMRDRIAGVRQRLVQALSARIRDRDWSFIERQRGLFSYTGLTEAQVDHLRERYSIYMTRDGRVNVAGITSANLEYVADAIADAIRTVS